MGRDEKNYKGLKGVGRDGVIRNRKGWGNTGSEGMG